MVFILDFGSSYQASRVMSQESAAIYLKKNASLIKELFVHGNAAGKIAITVNVTLDNGGQILIMPFVIVADEYLKRIDDDYDSEVSVFAALTSAFYADPITSFHYNRLKALRGDALLARLKELRSMLCKFDLREYIKYSVGLLLTAENACSERKYLEKYLQLLQDYAWALVHIDNIMTDAEKEYYAWFRSCLVSGVEDGREAVTPFLTSIKIKVPTFSIPNENCDSGQGPINTELQKKDITEDILLEIQGMTGLKSIKKEIQELVNVLKVQQVREQKGLPVPSLGMHMIFYGNPGTGKTTIARKLAQLYKSLGVLSKGHLVETDRSGLVGAYVGQTAIKTLQLLESSLGGVLFIDEAYSLASADGNDFGGEAIDTIVKFMEDHRDDLVIIAAGYRDEMSQFINSNPGLKSRFTKYLNFPDYTSTELKEIYLSLALRSGYSLAQDAEQLLLCRLQLIELSKGPGFGNGRMVRNLFEQTVVNQANRVVGIPDPTEEDLIGIIAQDLESISPVDVL